MHSICKQSPHIPFWIQGVFFNPKRCAFNGAVFLRTISSVVAKSHTFFLILTKAGTLLGP